MFLFLRLPAIQVLIYQGFISAEKERKKKKKKGPFAEKNDMTMDRTNTLSFAIQRMNVHCRQYFGSK